MYLEKKNMEREIMQAIASKLVISKQLSENALNIIATSSAKLANQLHKQFEREKKTAVKSSEIAQG